MLIITFVSLFLAAILGGLVVFLIPKVDLKKFKLILTFSGAFLFSITVTHILPELLSLQPGTDPAKIGIFILVGFFLQLILEFFSYGIEHGHIHHNKSDHHNNLVPYVLLISLSVHSLLEGTILINPVSINTPDPLTFWQIDMSTVLYGIILHKIPAAFALMSVLLYRLANVTLAVILLGIFALASPIGMAVSNLLIDLISGDTFIIIMAIVSGSFLHISTTILFEASPDHRFNWVRLLFAVLGAVMAIFTLFIL
ncbi:MAG: ZIP family metal transporter [Bacteroidetes bacterium]|nr:ZIP family metal transporter [Bacteroidota bacterium]